MLGDEGGLLDAPNVQVILVATNNTYKPIFYHCNDVAKAKLKESAARYDVSAKHLILTCSCSHHTHQLTHLHSLLTTQVRSSLSRTLNPRQDQRNAHARPTHRR